MIMYGNAYSRNGFGSVSDRYLREAIMTATPAQRVVMLYDQLLLDIATAEGAMEAPEPIDLKSINDHLVNAQEIVIVALRDGLRLDVWEGAANLYRLYTYIHGELVQANLNKDVDRLRTVKGLVKQLADAFRVAASGQEAAILSGNAASGNAADVSGNSADLVAGSTLADQSRIAVAGAG
jgi:flagellar protein FliS